MWAFERKAWNKGFSFIAGVDEVGRGPLAGPVVSAAVILPESFPDTGITDSKKLSPKQRDLYFSHICDHAVTIGIGIVDSAEIDQVNILQASLFSMGIAVNNLHPAPDFVLIDGIFHIPSDIPQKTIKKGDSLSISIASASIIAKVTRDRLMEKYHQQYPLFAFNKHKGYPTKSHREAIRKHGSCPIHRKSFKGVREYLNTV
ncbi:MAG: ribonuclease HII [Deltaproteobacteria bacterium]|nr:MAG: ribonuclease HII [Deltaproteobacteria bacterium]